MDANNLSINMELRKRSYGFCDLINTRVKLIRCISGSVVGIWSAYIFPLLSVLTITFNLVLFYILIKKGSQLPRHVIYMFWIFTCGVLTDVFVGWLWLFPTRGLPRASNGKLFFSIFSLSPSACRLHRFFYSLTSTMTCNLLVVSAMDRLLTVCFPRYFRKRLHFYAWYSCGVTLIISIITILPFAIMINWYDDQYRIQCWVPKRFAVLHTLVSNFGPIQTTILIILNVALLICTRCGDRKQNSQEPLESIDHENEVTISVYILSGTYALIAIPQSIAYIILRVSTLKMSNTMEEIIFDIAHYTWCLNSLRQIIDFVVFMKYFKALKE
ncbi:hypothetical protein MN116_001124 [Schistosoma mekongi]|uniref:G-protein coupled receptors family 1 profile domain-containing protein n=1 Tax=Schistosoma mekongi TaxID=38744 RepID=A0AAE1ZL61_SCHME|nr:hypothetical protein MN116_001124 [Schistosoma mekongi]